MNFKEIFELFGAANLGDFSDNMDLSRTYSTTFWVMLIIPLLVTVLYYIVLDHILLAKTKKWLFIGVVTCAATAVIDMIIARMKMGEFIFTSNITNTHIDAGDYLSFGFIVFAYSALLYFIFSLILKSFSSRSRNVPF